MVGKKKKKKTTLLKETSFQTHSVIPLGVVVIRMSRYVKERVKKKFFKLHSMAMWKKKMRVGEIGVKGGREKVVRGGYEPGFNEL